MAELPLLEVVLRLLVGTLLGAAIGMERESAGKPAGLRTNALVAAGAALLGIVSIAGFPDVTVDESRVAAAVVSGIGFLGAGAVLSLGGRARNLTTAAAVWVAASVGLAAGLGHGAAAAAATVIALALLAALDQLTRRLARDRRAVVRDAYVLVDGAEGVSGVADTLAAHQIEVLHLELVALPEGRIGVDVVLRGTNPALAEALGAARDQTDVLWAGSEQR